MDRIVNRSYGQGAVVVLGAALLLASCGQKPEAESARPQEPAEPAPMPQVAEAMPVNKGPEFGEAVATLDGSTNTPVLAQVSGYLVRQAYEEGATVKAGDLLFEIDPRGFEASVVKPTVGASGESNYARITAPVGGVAGRAIPGVGDFIGLGATLTTVSTVDPIRADFILPAKDSGAGGSPAAVDSSTAQATGLPEQVELVLADGTVYPQTGKLYLSNQPVPGEKPALAEYALFPNADGVLRPGQFAKVRGAGEEKDDGVLVPMQAVIQVDGKAEVMVAGPDNMVQLRRVMTGNASGANQIITSGLRAGERVVIVGRRVPAR